MVPSYSTYTYIPEGVCIKKIELTIDSNNNVLDVVFTGGCAGNLNVIRNLMIGKNYYEFYDLFRDNKCGKRLTSCADQLANLLDDIKGAK